MKLGLIALGFAPILAACGSATFATPSSSSDTASIELRATQVFTAITGDAHQREAAHYLSFLELNAPFDTCMKVHGITVRSGFSPIWAGYTPNATSGSWMGVVGIAPSAMVLANAESARAEGASPHAGSQEATQGYQSAVDACQSEDVQRVDLGNLPGVPSGSAELTGEFKQMIWSIDDKLGSIEPYNACMESAGIKYQELAEGSQGWQGLYKYLVAKMPRAPLPNERTSAEWNDYLQLEAHALETDGDCRADKYREGLALLEPMLGDFEAQHADQLTRMATQWDVAVQTAELKGLSLR